MAPNPIIFALANPNPEILPEIAKQVRPDVIIATGRSDYPNQVNNLIAFPYIFRGALDVRASSINDSMKLAAVEAIAYLARETVPESVSAVYGNQKIQYGREYILPSIFDPRLIYTVSAAVAEAAMKSGVAQNPIKDMDAYKNRLKKRLQSNNTL
jgi:malate dehydrogenase (oxaloacetate-decarboxylating)(NADP+)